MLKLCTKCVTDIFIYSYFVYIKSFDGKKRQKLFPGTFYFLGKLHFSECLIYSCISSIKLVILNSEKEPKTLLACDI
jgi:hypothetical protein